jgi:ferredoxin-NADP reductase
MTGSSLITLTIKQIVQETADTKSFILEAAEPVAYTAGQFLTFIFYKANGEEERRSYSISSSPAMDEPLQVTVKRVANGAWSRWLIDKAREGDVLRTIGATGFFVLPENLQDYRQLVFFAAGSGITPVFSLLKTALRANAELKAVLLYSNTSPDKTIFYEGLRELQEKYPGRLHIEFMFSTARPRQRLNVSAIERIAHHYAKDTLYYLCGPMEYMRTISIVLRTAGIAEYAIRKEIFHVEKPVIKELPPDTLPHMVTAYINDQQYQFEVAYPATILQRAKTLGIPIPYSCEAGQCGTCSATCISGNVWMWHNEVLLDEELAAGRVLTCTGYPVDGDPVLKF